jgi:hypothetical protein
MKGIKANRKMVTNVKSEGGWGNDGKWHIAIQPTDNKRPQDVIDIDSQEGTPSYIGLIDGQTTHPERR